VTVRVLGMSELNKQLKALGPRIEKNILRGGVRAVAREIANDAKANVPADTGNLRRNIVVRGFRGQRTRGKNRDTVRAGVVIREEGKRGKIVRGEGGALGIKVLRQNNAFYWRFVEYGTKRMPARPFLRPAYDRMQSRISQVMGGYIRARIDKEIAKGAKVRRAA